jgi:8-amino-7-oxononanoate synthase
MDGDLAPVSDLLALANEFDAWLMTDDAHGLGVVSGANTDVPLQMGTLSKAVGSYGGYLCASASVIELMRNRARTLIYSTGLPPSVVAASIAALEIIEREPDYCARPIAKARAFTRMLNLPDAQSPIVPIIVGAEDNALAASRKLAEHGFYVSAVRPPTVPPGTARLRLTFTAQHPDEEIARLAQVVRDDVLAAA